MSTGRSACWQPHGRNSVHNLGWKSDRTYRIDTVHNPEVDMDASRPEGSIGACIERQDHKLRGSYAEGTAGLGCGSGRSSAADLMQ